MQVVATGDRLNLGVTYIIVRGVYFTMVCLVSPMHAHVEPAGRGTC